MTKIIRENACLLVGCFNGYLPWLEEVPGMVATTLQNHRFWVGSLVQPVFQMEEAAFSWLFDVSLKSEQLMGWNQVILSRPSKADCGDILEGRSLLLFLLQKTKLDLSFRLCPNWVVSWNLFSLKNANYICKKRNDNNQPGIVQYSPQWGHSNEYLQYMFLWQIEEKKKDLHC